MKKQHNKINVKLSQLIYLYFVYTYVHVCISVDSICMPWTCGQMVQRTYVHVVTCTCMYVYVKYLHKSQQVLFFPKIFYKLQDNISIYALASHPHPLEMPIQSISPPLLPLFPSPQIFSPEKKQQAPRMNRRTSYKDTTQ